MTLTLESLDAAISAARHAGVSPLPGGKYIVFVHPKRIEEAKRLASEVVGWQEYIEIKESHDA